MLQADIADTATDRASLPGCAREQDRLGEGHFVGVGEQRVVFSTNSGC